ncbi:hypothetical protein ALT721_1090072 [Alteromonas alvinellae]
MGGFYACSCASLVKGCKRKNEKYYVLYYLFHEPECMSNPYVCQPIFTKCIVVFDMRGLKKN